MTAPLEIKARKTYLTRGGAKVRILTTDAKIDIYPIVGLRTRTDGLERCISYTAGGSYIANGPLHQFDLVKEYVEPPKPREVWVLFGINGMPIDLYRGPGRPSWSTAALFREVLPEESSK